jgi:hypothetical protein
LDSINIANGTDFAFDTNRTLSENISYGLAILFLRSQTIGLKQRVRRLRFYWIWNLSRFSTFLAFSATINYDFQHADALVFCQRVTIKNENIMQTLNAK